MSSDAELVMYAQRGDATALGILFERHRASLYALALRMLGHGPRAQDAVQETFLIALRRIDRLHEPAAVGKWLRMVLRNACLMQLRESRREAPFEEAYSYAGRGSLASPVEETIEQMALREWVWAALSELSEPLRVTVMLRYFGSYASYEEISAILGVPVGTVRSRLNQVKVKLADALLETARLAHDEARRLAESQTRFFEAAYEEFNRGDGWKVIPSALSDDDFAWGYSDGTALRGREGREFLIHGLEKESQEGVKLHPTNIVVGKDIAILEGDFGNPPDDPFHCPPATSMVHFYRDGRIHRVRQYYAPRPEKVRRDHPR